ncbi:glycoside hydrolase family 43 protein [Endozoicomonas gorgoniicola]|uniref:Glycoside hydrolase family 43 protein n=1 Tax=Endozoicomonas gorgoniicola TaxID=1234144 RepID=A0ABT3N1U0_9GAMM|nr:glycoside hydrolase family 43 protein [Endozoicomonas gorgoniicola]MCW7555607.1 glycoside hydrolase family 43 protein [Endozoicomonas gorgoniicola]
MSFTNPILPGAYPDPSICRVGDDFYMVNSSFEMFPGLPIHHSRDLVNWELVGHGLHRKEQCIDPICLTDVQSDGGIHAPTMRYHNGLFYIITTNVYVPQDCPEGFNPCKNFIITAKDPAGPWSEPQVIDGAPGIDPDIFFDDDGRVWYVGTHTPEDQAYPGQGEIWLQELDLATVSLKGERHFLWRGTGGDWVEGPHIYKYNGRYYLMTAEGGTGFNHAVTVASSATITGPYVSNPKNPVLTSRHLGLDYWVNSTGHGDLVQMNDGRWFMVCLGIRNDIEGRSNMGRETHLVPVTWEADHYGIDENKSDILWPVCAPGTGRVEQEPALPFPDRTQIATDSFTDNFTQATLKKDWTFRRLPDTTSFQVLPDQQRLRIRSGKPVNERVSASLAGFRQKSSLFAFQATLHLPETFQHSESGISLIQKDHHHLVMSVLKKDNDLKIAVSLNGEELSVSELPPETRNLDLVITCDERGYHCSYRVSGESSNEVIDIINNIPANSLLSRYYTGALCCLHSFSKSESSIEYVDFSEVHFRQLSA